MRRPLKSRGNTRVDATLLYSHQVMMIEDSNQQQQRQHAVLSVNAPFQQPTPTL